MSISKLKTVVCGTFASLCLISVYATAELKLPEEKAFQKTQLPKVKFKPGRFIDPVPKTWGNVLLDGRWKFKRIEKVEDFKNILDDIGIKDGYHKLNFDDSKWDKKLVPWSWYKEEPGEARKSNHVTSKLGWYRHSFKISPKQLTNGKRIVLDFRRVANQLDLWVNGKKTGDRKEARFNSVQYDITSNAHPGKNVIAVRVYDCIGNTGYRMRQFGGIYEPVRLLTIPSNVYTNNMMITTLFDKKAIDVKADIINESKKTMSFRFVAEIANWKDGKIIVKKKLSPVTLAPGETCVSLGKINIPDPINWSPGKPHLYTLTLKDSNGKAAGLERFGFRELTYKGEWLYLNGKKFKPRMYAFNKIMNNNNSKMEHLLRILKSSHVNMLRSHSGASGVLPETFFNLCDEIGMMVYVDWSGLTYIKGLGSPENSKEKFIKSAWPALRNFIKDHYNHPCFSMLSFKNEVYEGQHGYFSKKFDALYGLVKKFDKQNRPISTSTGRQTKEAMQAGTIKERTDLLDDHQYRGATSGSWQDNIKHLVEYAKTAEKYYKVKKPKINAEYGVPGDNLRYRTCTFNEIWPAFQRDPASKEFKTKYISFLRSKKAEIGGYIRGKMNYCSPRQYIEETPCRERYASHFFKRPVEIYRRAGTKCLGSQANTPLYDLVRNGKGGNTSSFYGKPGPIPQKEGLFDMPLKFMLKRLYNPTLVTVGVFNEHPMPESKQKLEVFVTNDLNEAANFNVVMQLRFNKGKAIKLADLDFGKIKGMEQKSKQLEYTVPKVKGRKRGKLEFYLFKNSKRAGDNYYPITVIDNSTKVLTTKKVALYDVAGKIFRGLGADSSLEVLNDLSLRTEVIDNFSALDKYKHLIIGVNSFDKKLINSSKTIYDWVKSGGKILCFEQSLCGKIPFYPNYSITAGSPSTFVSLSMPNHPAFKNLTQDDFDSWAGNKGLMFDYAISPLNEGFVAVVPTGSSHDFDNIKPIIADVKVGKGEIIFSQIAASKRVNTDSVAREYVRNLLQYFLTKDVQPYAFALSEKDFAKIVYVDDKDAYPIDISKFVNRGFLDEKAGDKKGGWADLGSGFDGIPTGLTRLQGGVPFKIINPANNNGKSCIVLKGSKRLYFPAKVTGIPVNAKLNSMYFLHTAMYAKKGPAIEYVFHYANGQTRKFIATNDREIPDWWHAKDRSNAVVVFRKGNRGLYMSEFVNPLPKENIKSMDIISYGKSIPIILGITGRKRFTSVISGVGEK
jgi:beta-galactosidase